MIRPKLPETKYKEMEREAKRFIKKMKFKKKGQDGFDVDPELAELIYMDGWHDGYIRGQADSP